MYIHHFQVLPLPITTSCVLVMKEDKQVAILAQCGEGSSFKIDADTGRTWLCTPDLIPHGKLQAAVAIYKHGIQLDGNYPQMNVS